MRPRTVGSYRTGARAPGSRHAAARRRGPRRARRLRGVRVAGGFRVLRVQ
ncbi:hypothetical protein BZZ08_07357 [Streptomyces sp. MH60]|nr:hypothetical protein BZZ08_07357 [Streptomyces sp. MH60]